MLIFFEDEKGQLHGYRFTREAMLKPKTTKGNQNEAS